MAKTFKKIMNAFLVLVLLMDVLSETINVFVKKKETSKKKASNLPSRRSGKRSRKKNTLCQRQAVIEKALRRFVPAKLYFFVFDLS